MADNNSYSSDVDLHAVVYHQDDSFQSDKSVFHASRNYYRFIILFTAAWMTIGPYYCIDMPSVMQSYFTAKMGYHCNTTTDNRTVCIEGLGLSETEYNSLYTSYSWVNALVVIFSGFLIDKYGNRVGCILFSFLCLVGMAIFASGYYVKTTGWMLPMFLIGRIIFGAGVGSLALVQNRISAFWFDGKELAFAFGCTVAIARMGTVLNFGITEKFCEDHGLKTTLLGGVVVCAVGFVVSFILAYIDRKGVEQLRKSEDLKMQSKIVRFSDVRYFNMQFWLLVITTMFFYNSVFPFVADGSKFIHITYGYRKETSTLVIGALYAVSMVMLPLMGILIDHCGLRGILSAICAALTMPVFAFLTFFHQVPPLVNTIWLGVTYSIGAACLWPSVPLVINPSSLGTALGVMTAVQMAGSGICNLIIGEILDIARYDPLRWRYCMLFLLANTFLCFFVAIGLNLVDWRRGGVLNKTTKHKRIMSHKKKQNFKPGYTDTDALIYNEHEERYLDDSIN